MNDFQTALLEANFLFNLIASMEREIHMIKPVVKNNIGSGKYERLKDLTHDVKILKGLYAVNHEYILKHYEEIESVEFQTL